VSRKSRLFLPNRMGRHVTGCSRVADGCGQAINRPMILTRDEVPVDRERERRRVVTKLLAHLDEQRGVRVPQRVRLAVADAGPLKQGPPEVAEAFVIALSAA